jgi:hypothetical protein
LINSTSAPDLAGPGLAPNTSKPGNTITRSTEPSLYTEKVRRVKQLESELKMVKGQVAGALSKAKRAADRKAFAAGNLKSE